jgi:hypothetical protein
MAKEDDFKFPDEDGEAATAAARSTGHEAEIDFSDNADGVEVSVVDDTPAEDRGRPALDTPVEDPTDDELKEYSGKVQERIKKLTHARHDERRRADSLQRERDELERVAAETLAANRDLQRRVQAGTKVFAEQGVTLADKAVEDAKAKLRAAHEAFNTDAIVDAQTELNEAQMRRAAATNMRERAVQQEENVVELPQTAQPKAPTLDAKTSEWMAENKWFGDSGDEAMTGYALGLHQKLVKKYGEGFTRTDEYFSQIDAGVRQTFPTFFRSNADAGKPTTQKSAVAPASRTLAPRKVTLTSTQVVLAKKLGLTPQQYAAELVKVEN